MGEIDIKSLAKPLITFLMDVVAAGVSGGGAGAIAGVGAVVGLGFSVSDLRKSHLSVEKWLLGRLSNVSAELNRGQTVEPNVVEAAITAITWALGSVAPDQLGLHRAGFRPDEFKKILQNACVEVRQDFMSEEAFFDDLVEKIAGLVSEFAQGAPQYQNATLLHLIEQTDEVLARETLIHNDTAFLIEGQRDLITQIVSLGEMISAEKKELRDFILRSTETSFQQSNDPLVFNLPIDDFSVQIGSPPTKS